MNEEVFKQNNKKLFLLGFLLLMAITKHYPLLALIVTRQEASHFVGGNSQVSIRRGTKPDKLLGYAPCFFTVK